MLKNDTFIIIRLPTKLNIDFEKVCKKYNFSKSCYLRRLIACEVVKNGENVKPIVNYKL